MEKTAKFTASKGLLLGWCFSQKINPDELTKEDSEHAKKYKNDLRNLTQLCQFAIDLEVITYSDFQALVLEEVRQALNILSVISSNPDNFTGLWRSDKKGTELAILLKLFMLITPEEAAEVEVLGGSGTTMHLELTQSHKAYRPKGLRAPWVTTVERIEELHNYSHALETKQTQLLAQLEELGNPAQNFEILYSKIQEALDEFHLLFPKRRRLKKIEEILSGYEM